MTNPSHGLLPTVSAKISGTNTDSYLCRCIFISFGFLSQSFHPQFARPTAAPSSSDPAHAYTDHTEIVGTCGQTQPVRGNNKASYPAQFCPPRHSVRKHADDFYKTAPKSQPFFCQLSKKHAKTGVNFLFIFYHFRYLLCYSYYTILFAKIQTESFAEILRISPNGREG